MNECKNCELAIYCYSDSTTWIFRTKQEMDEKVAKMVDCPLHQQVRSLRSGTAQEGPEAKTG